MNTNSYLKKLSKTYYAVRVYLHGSYEPIPISESWRTALKADETVDNSDKTFTVPASTEWEISSIWIELATTNTVGNRQITVEMQDSAGDVIGQFKAGATQAASLAYTYMFAPGIELMVIPVNLYLSFPLPVMFLPAGFKVRVYDSAAIDPAADDLNIQMMIAARSV